MGEAKRRARRAPGGADRLPDFFFLRERAAEDAGGFTLAGKLVTDIPRHSEPGEGDRQLISEIVGEVTRLARGDPDLEVACAWRSSSELPPDALSTTFPADAVNERVKRCGVVVVRIDRNGRDELMRIDGTLKADVMVDDKRR
jgi:hypothetical protein